MAIYYFPAKVISRAAGSSALASAVYRSASRLHDGRPDRTHDFSYEAGVVRSEMIPPDGAPEYLSDRERLWNEVAAAEQGEEYSQRQTEPDTVDHGHRRIVQKGRRSYEIARGIAAIDEHNCPIGPDQELRQPYAGTKKMRRLGPVAQCARIETATLD